MKVGPLGKWSELLTIETVQLGIREVIFNARQRKLRTSEIISNFGNSSPIRPHRRSRAFKEFKNYLNSVSIITYIIERENLRKNSGKIELFLMVWFREGEDGFL